jgi:hypothetical protein
METARALWLTTTAGKDMDMDMDMDTDFELPQERPFCSEYCCLNTITDERPS